MRIENLFNNHYRDKPIISTNKAPSRIEVLARVATKKVGYVNAFKNCNDKWTVNQFYIDKNYNQFNSLSNNLINRINNLRDADISNAVSSILEYFEKD